MTNAPLHVCVMGHSGIGKSPLSNLFCVPGWDPFRVRKPRDDKDKAMTEEHFRALLVDGVLDLTQAGGEKLERGPLVYPTPPTRENSVDGQFIRKTYEDGGLCVCAGWSFFKVRDADQCLCHSEFKPSSSMRIEIFAPRLLTFLRERERLKPAFELSPGNILVVLLNPTARAFGDMGDEPSAELRLSCALSVMERARTSGSVPDLADALRRVGYISEELAAWRAFVSDRIVDTLECLEWSHFEYCYHANAPGELDRARAALYP